MAPENVSYAFKANGKFSWSKTLDLGLWRLHALLRRVDSSILPNPIPLLPSSAHSVSHRYCYRN